MNLIRCDACRHESTDPFLTVTPGPYRATEHPDRWHVCSWGCLTRLAAVYDPAASATDRSSDRG